MDYLTESAEFICNQGGKISCKYSGNKKNTYDGKTLLTTPAKMKTKDGICAIMNNAAYNCQLTALWTGFSPSKILNGKLLLTDKAKIICTLGGQIIVLNSGVSGHITAGSTLASISVAAAKILRVCLRTRLYNGRTGRAPAALNEVMSLWAAVFFLWLQGVRCSSFLLRLLKNTPARANARTPRICKPRKAFLSFLQKVKKCRLKYKQFLNVKCTQGI